ncbi:MAG: hypothetical protein ACREEL_07715 [Stellaceae bacterium]
MRNRRALTGRGDSHAQDRERSELGDDRPSGVAPAADDEQPEQSESGRHERPACRLGRGKELQAERVERQRLRSVGTEAALNDFGDRSALDFARKASARLSMNAGDSVTKVRITLREIDRAPGADQNLTP